MLSSFKDTVDSMTVEQKRAAIRTFVKEVVWDGQRAHVVLFGSDYEYEFPKNTEKAADGCEPPCEYSK